GAQSVAPPRQVTLQAPFEHTSPPEHACPHAPQLAGSLAVWTQSVPQSVVPPRQVTPHLPVEQTWPLGHAVPQAPQLAGSFCVSTQRPPPSPPQSVAPPRQ